MLPITNLAMSLNFKALMANFTQSESVRLGHCVQIWYNELHNQACQFIVICY
jgi:hypothetical protein